MRNNIIALPFYRPTFFLSFEHVRDKNNENINNQGIEMIAPSVIDPWRTMKNLNEGFRQLEIEEFIKH